MTTQQFLQMVELALEHWDFESADEPYCSSRQGLEYLLDNPLSRKQLAETEASGVKLLDTNGNFNWDWLQELAVSCSGG
jgi:hypothetical protein